MTPGQENAIRAAGCEVHFDNLTRQLYATDASIYQIEPEGVAFPRSAQQASAVIRAAADANVSVTPRGAGTSLVGNAIGEGLIVDFSRYNRQITDLNIDNRTVRVGAGVVLDQLNAFLKPHGFCFGPDVATSSRATLGGMIANNSSGARVPVYGTTADHVVSLEIVMADGRIETIGPDRETMRAERDKIDNYVRARAAEIAERMPPGILKRWPGYGIERFLRAPNNLNEILAGSEGTLAAIFSAELKISPLPREKGLGLIFFASVDEAMQATVELLDLKPAAIEHIDRPLLDQTKGQLLFPAARDLMELDAKPCPSILIVEFYEDVAERLSILQSRNLGLRTKIVTDAKEMDLAWSVRKAGLSLLTGCIGAAKPVAFIEDAAVRPAQLPEYVRGLQSIMKPLGLDASYYGHAASGLLHVRPVLDLHSKADLKKLRQVADQTSALVRQFKGSLSAEHGVGIARTEYMHEQLGDELLGVMREIKHTFDPKNIFNPGKIFSDGRHKIDNHLRMNFERPMKLPFEPRLAFAFKDRSFIGNLEQCNGCGGCRKDAPMMCPTFVATGDEVMSTRGRANIIRAALELRVNGHDPLKSAELDAALSNCLACKGCTPECPSNVNLALLKAEMMYARHRRDGLPLLERVLSNIDLLGRLGCALPSLANAIADLAPVRALMEKTLGLSAKRSLPHYANQRFDRWFAKRSSNDAKRGKVILVGRHVCALSRTPHRHRRGESARSARIRSDAGARSTMLRPAGIQSGKSRCRRKSRTTQRRSFRQQRRARSDHFSRAFMLVDVCGRLSRAEDRERGENRGALFSLRKICRRFTFARAARAAGARSTSARGDSCALPREDAHQSRVHGATGRTITGKTRHRARHRMLRNGGCVWNVGREIRSLRQGRGRPSRQDRQSTSRSRRCVGHELSSPDCRSYQRHTETHGRAHRGSDRLNNLCARRARYPLGGAGLAAVFGGAPGCCPGGEPPGISASGGTACKSGSVNESG